MKEGYHLTEIPKGKLGTRSKIQEEYLEWVDSCKQGCKVMELVELSDLLGAIEHYTKNNYNISLTDLVKMNNITQRVFKNGRR